MRAIGEAFNLDELRRRVAEARARQSDKDITTSITPDLSQSSECPHGCVDGLIVNGWSAKECVCLQQRRLNARLKNAMIPEEFENAEFARYRTETSMQAGMLEYMQRYLNRFEDLLPQQQNGFGFLAVFGEARLREMKGTTRAQAKAQHNNFGLGKTHLQVAAAKELIRRGFTVFCISDVAFMDELSRARAYNDDGAAVSRLLTSAIRADVLVWDDIGKAKPSDYRLDMYYQIINERYKAKRPIIFSSNEDSETLTERIGDAAASRLLGMARGNTFAVEGKDYRLTGGGQS